MEKNKFKWYSKIKIRNKKTKNEKNHKIAQETF